MGLGIIVNAALKADVYWRQLLAISVAVAAGYCIYRGFRDFLEYPYIQLLVTYHFGFSRRALVGTIVSLFVDRVPAWLPFALGLAAIIAAAVLFAAAFRKVFGFKRENMPVLVFTAGSPLLFKGFVAAIGYFDIYGFIIGLALLVMPCASFFYVVAAAAGCVFLTLVHHVQIALYIPTIMIIVGCRYMLVRRLSAAEIGAVLLVLTAICGLAVAAQFFGSVPAPKDEFTSYLLSRSDAHADTPKWLQYAYVYYRPLSEEIADTWARLPTNALRFPLYAFLIALHWPLLQYFGRVVGAGADPTLRLFAKLSAIGVAVAYVAVFAMVFDYARWLGDLAACFVLLLFAFKQLPAAKAVAPIPLNDPTVFWAAAILSCIPKAGF